MTDLCTYHAGNAARCLSKTGHQDDGATADRLRADLARVCPTKWCGTTRPEPKEHQ